MGRVSDRKEFYGLLNAVVNNNRDYFLRYGNWKYPQIKIFWLEVNLKHLSALPHQMEKIDNKLYEVRYKDEVYWIDTRDERIWEIFTLSSTQKTNSMLNNIFTNTIGIDRLWFTEKFMLKIRKKLGYDDRGFGIKFKDILTEGKDIADFSAKFWLGKNSTNRQISFLELAKSSFSMSNIRFGRTEIIDNDLPLSQLYELSYNGHMTVTTSTDTDSIFNVINTIEKQYKNNLIFLEKESKKKPVVVEVTYKDSVNISGFDAITSYGTRDLKLWLQNYEIGKDFGRYSGVDLHTGDFIYLDMADQYSYVTADENACMNVAPRFGTLSSRYLSSSTELFYDGVELFA